MNRAQRRKYNKDHKTSYSKAEFDLALAMARIRNGDVSYDDIAKLHGAAHMDNEVIAPEGCEVKLDYDGIMARPQNMLTDEFKAWVEENKEKEFHLTREGAADSLVSLVEDVRYADVDGEQVMAQRWLFDLYSDLLIKSGDDWKHAYEIEDEGNYGYTDITPAVNLAEAYAKHVEDEKTEKN